MQATFDLPKLTFEANAEETFYSPSATALLHVVFFMLGWVSALKSSLVTKQKCQCCNEAAGTWEAVWVNGLQQQKEVGPVLGILFKVLHITHSARPHAKPYVTKLLSVVQKHDLAHTRNWS